jgi:hypothetical protein
MSLGVRIGIPSSSLSILMNTEPATFFPSTKTLVGMARCTASKSSSPLAESILRAPRYLFEVLPLRLSVWGCVESHPHELAEFLVLS